MSRPVVIASMMREHGETGVQTHVRAVRDWLASHGWEVSLVTPFSCPRWLVYPVFAARRLIDRISKPASVWWYRHWHAVFLRQALRSRLRAGVPCTVYAQCPLSADAALSARASSSQKVVMVVHFNISQADEWADKGMVRRDGGFYKSMQAFEAEVLPRVDALIYVSDFMRRELERRIHSLSKVPFHVIPNFLVDPGEPVCGAAQTDLITVGTLEYRKNQRYALEILHAAKQLGRSLTLTVVGDGPDRSMLEKRAVELGIDEQVHFAGFVSHAATLMPAHRACLHVAYMENLPLTLIEALSRGLPVFAPAAGGMPEVFEDGIQGRLIPLDDAIGAAKLIFQWLDSEEKLKTIRSLARHRFLDRFEADRVATQLAGVLSEVGQK